MIWNNENRQLSVEDEEKQKRQYYDYKFKKSGKITQKPSDNDYDSATVKRNKHLDGQDGADDYSSFATKKGSNYEFQFPSGQSITGFGSQDAKQQAKGEKRASKGRKRVGDSFTVSDPVVADQLFNLTAGNSFVEYGKIGYTEKDGDNEYNYIKTDRDPTKVAVEFGDFMLNKNVKDITHSHPFNPSGAFGTKLPSETDKSGYDAAKKDTEDKKSNFYKIEMPKHKIYNPITSDPNVLPYTLEYNERGAVFPDGVSNKDGNKAIRDYKNRLDGIMNKYDKEIKW